MVNYSWPGNIRELISAIRRGIVMAKTRVIHPDDLGLENPDSETTTRLPTLAAARNELERQMLQDAMEINQNNVKQSAQELGISRVAFYRLLRKHNILRGTDTNEGSA